jgi:hypothetical protein
MEPVFGKPKGNAMKRFPFLLGLAMLLALAAGTAPSFGQLADSYTPSSVSYLSQGRYLMFQGNYLNEKGEPEAGLVKFDSNTGMAWMLRPAPRTNDAPLEFKWMPVKN